MERYIKFLERFLVLAVAVCNIVELVFHFSRERIRNIFAKIGFEECRNDVAGVGRVECAALLGHIAAFFKRAHDGGVGRRAADAALLERFDERRFAVAVGRLGGFLRACEVEEFECFACRDFRQFNVFAARIAVYLEPAGEEHSRAVGGKVWNVVVSDNVRYELGLQKFGIGHLARYGTLPDEFVERFLLVVHTDREFFDVRRTDSFVCLLRVF